MRPLLAKYSNSIMTVIMLIVFVVMVAIAGGYPNEARFMPFVVGIPAIILCFVQLFMDARERNKSAEKPQTHSHGREVDAALAQAGLPSTSEVELLPQEHVRRELILCGYFLGFIAGILLLGFWGAIPVFLVAFLRFQAKASWTTSLVLGLGASLALFFIFERGLKVQLHRGFVAGYVMDQLER